MIYDDSLDEVSERLACKTTCEHKQNNFCLLFWYRKPIYYVNFKSFFKDRLTCKKMHKTLEAEIPTKVLQLLLWCFACQFLVRALGMKWWDNSRLFSERQKVLYCMYFLLLHLLHFSSSPFLCPNLFVCPEEALLRSAHLSTSRCLLLMISSCSALAWTVCETAK